MRRVLRPLCGAIRSLTLLCLFWACLAPALHAAASGVPASASEQAANEQGGAARQIAQPAGQPPAPAAPAASGAPTATPTETPVRVSQYSFGSYIKALSILCLAVAALWFALWLFRRYGKRFSPMLSGVDRNVLRVEAQLPLGPRRGLVVVRFEDERLLLGVTEQHISYLASHPAANGGTPPDGTAKPFAAFLDSFSRNRKTEPGAPAPKADGGADV